MHYNCISPPSYFLSFWPLIYYFGETHLRFIRFAPGHCIGYLQIPTGTPLSQLRLALVPNLLHSVGLPRCRSNSCAVHARQATDGLTSSFGINSDGSLSRARTMSSSCLPTAFAQMSRSTSQAHPAAQALQPPTRPQEPVTRAESRDRVSSKDATQTYHYAQ